MKVASIHARPLHDLLLEAMLDNVGRIVAG